MWGSAASVRPRRHISLGEWEEFRMWRGVVEMEKSRTDEVKKGGGQFAEERLNKPMNVCHTHID